MPVYIDRDTYSKWNGEVIGQQADLIKEDIAAAPPLPPVESPSPPPAPAQPTFQSPTPSDSLTQPVPRATPGPPALTDLLAAAGLAESPSPSAGGAATGAQPGAAPAPSGGIPSLDSLLQSAGLGNVGGAVSGAAQTVASAAPPPLQDLMRSAGLLDQPKSAQPQPAEAAASITTQPGGAQFGNEVNQFQLGLSDADAYAFCGPAAAIAFSRQYGRNPTAAEARQLAVTVGWSPDQGMAGIDSERALLSKMGVATRMESNGRQDAPAFSWDHVTQDAMNGNPVVLDTPGHYYYVDGARTDNGQVVYHVGQSGLELRGGREWMTAGEINAMSQSKGSVRGALYADNPQTPHPSVANASPSATQSATQTTAGLSGGGALSGQIGERGQQIMSGAAQAASWLGDQGQKALQAVLMTEGGLNNARGDNGQSVGPLQFYTGGQLANLAQQLGMGLEQAKQWVEQNPGAAVQWAIGTPDKPGYLGAAIQKGLQAGLQGADLATYAQRHGQVSVSPERAGQNYAALFGGGQGVIQGAAGAVQGAAQTAQSTFADLAQSGGNLASQGAALAQGLTQPAGESPTAAVEREANQRMAALQDTLNTSLQGTQQAQDQRSVQASTIGGGLAGRGAVNVTDAGGGLTPEQITQNAPQQPAKPLWAQIGDTIGSAISQGLQPLVQAFQGTPTPAPATGSPAIVPEGGGYGATGLAPVEQTGPIGQAAIGAGQVAQQVQTPEADSVPLGPVGQAIGTAASVVGTALHAGQEAIRQVSPVSGAARTVAGSDEYARQYAALGGADLEREYRDLVQRRLNGEDGLEPRIQQIGDQLNTINAQITQGQPYEAAISQAAEQNPAFPAIETAANVGAAGLALPLAAEGAPLAARVLAEVLQPGTNPLEVARGAFELVRGADAADPGTEQAVRAAWESFGQRWSDSAAQRERMLSQIGDPRGFLERVRDNLASAGGAVARGVQGVLEDVSRPTRGGVVGEAPAAVNADRFYHGTGSDFPSPDAARFEPNGLFGPGYYLTSDPRVAGGVVAEGGERAGMTAADEADPVWGKLAQQRRTPGEVISSGYAQQRDVDPVALAEADRLERALQNATPQYRADNEGWMQDQIDRLRNYGTGPNVRAVDVPKGLNLLNADAPISVDESAQIVQAAGLRNVPSDWFNGVTGTEVRDSLVAAAKANNVAQPEAEASRMLADAGYDGIQYAGGKRIPMADQAGAPIEHTVVVVFPESLDKLTNATAGTRGGLLPDVAGENLARQVATRAAVGGTGAGIQESQDPNATPGDVARAAAQGAVLGGARPLVGRAIPGLRIAPEVGRIARAIGDPLERFGLSKEPVEGQAPPTVAAQLPLPAPGSAWERMRQMYQEGAVKPPPPDAAQRLESARDWVTRTFFNRNVDLDRIQERYAQALGRPLNADEMVSELSRLAPSPAAEVAVHEGMGPAIRSVGDDYEALRDFVTARSNIQVADGLGNEARLFSGGLTKLDSQRAVMEMRNALGPERFKAVQDAADQVSQFGRELRQRLVDSSVLSQEQADAMEAKYPDWVKTRILDYMDPAGGKGGQTAGSKIGLSARDVHAYTEAGTTRAREDPLASMVAYANQAEKMARKNDTFNALLKVDQASPAPLLRQVAQDYSPTANQVTINGFVNGEKQKWVTDNKFLGEAINGTSVSAVPNWVSAWGRVFRAAATSRNPLFLAGNAALDIPTYVFRTAVREGGPEQLPRIMGALAGGYVDAFRGLLTGTYHGATADFLKSGGGQSNVYAQTAEDAQQAIAAMRRPNVFTIDNVDDLKRLVTGLVTLKPVEAIGERIEMGPRVAAYRMAQARGANPVQATIEGRTVTVDFSQGGTATKFLNQMIPFLNVGFQGPAQIARSFRENPMAFAKTTGTLIGLPAISAEVWNRADPQRAQDYADVPDYVKNQGIVVMLPGEVPVDPQGNRKPIYAVVKLREWAPFAALARTAASRVLGDDSRSWGDMAKDVLSGLSPTQATSVGQLGVEPLGGIPVLPAAAQLQFNQDFFRGRTIISQRADENASAAAKQLTPVIQNFLDAAGFQGDVHPSAVDFFIRNQGAGIGTAGLAASNIVAGQPPTTAGPETTPVVGGLASRFVGTQTGQQLDTARGEPLTSEAHRILRDNGITATPSPASGQINNVPLLQAEEARYQQSINQRVDAAIKETAASAQFQGLSQEAKQRVMRQAMDDARTQAGNDVMAGVPRQEQKDRLQRQADQQIKMATTDQQRQAAQGALNEGMAGLMWDEVPHFAGVRGTPDQIAQQNAQIQAARSKLAQYRTGLIAQGVRSDQATERAAALLRRDDPAAYRLSQRDTVDQEVLARQRRRIDQQTGGALSRNAEKAAEFQVLTRGGSNTMAGLTSVAPVLPTTSSSVFAPRASSALVGAGTGGLPRTPPVAP